MPSRRLLASPSPPLKDELALFDLASSSLEDSEVLLETIGNIPKDVREIDLCHGRRIQQPTLAPS
ncbi:hypothetical protein V8C34DRAFT_290275 [Trichoderma compactum]